MFKPNTTFMLNKDVQKVYEEIFVLKKELEHMRSNEQLVKAKVEAAFYKGVLYTVVGLLFLGIAGTWLSNLTT